MTSPAIKKATLVKVIKKLKTNNYTVVSTQLLTDSALLYLHKNYLVANTGKYVGSDGDMLLVCKQ